MTGRAQHSEMGLRSVSLLERRAICHGIMVAPRSTASGTDMIQGRCLCGAVEWRFEGVPEGATACNCTACRRYGVLWAYDYEGEGIRVSGDVTAFARGNGLTFNFCPTCGCLTFWRGLQTDQRGRRRIAVNLRLAEPDAVAAIPIDHFDGLNTFEDL